MTTIIEEDEFGREFLISLLATSIFGQCYPLAIALHRNLGWPMVGLFSDDRIIHAGVRSPEGKIWDGRGEVSQEEFTKPFAYISNVIRDVTEEELFARNKVSEHLVDMMTEKAQVVWPELPWKYNTFQDRIIAFADELEMLSRKHKLWICGNTPMSLPIVFKGCDDEVGYAIKPTLDGVTYTINRKL